jgi:hypothetical protein
MNSTNDTNFTRLLDIYAEARAALIEARTLLLEHGVTPALVRCALERDQVHVNKLREIIEPHADHTLTTTERRRYVETCATMEGHEGAYEEAMETAPHHSQAVH